MDMLCPVAVVVVGGGGGGGAAANNSGKIKTQYNII
jgi:acetyl-CoA carboxylase alpha subunit